MNFEEKREIVVSLPTTNPYRKVPTDSSITPASPTLSYPHSSNGYDKRSRNHRTGVKRRAILKNGDCNITKTQLSQRRYRFFHDIFTTLVDCQWRWTLLLFFLSFIFSWLFFAVIYWLAAYAHGDLEFLHLPPMQETNGWQPCIVNIFSFTSIFVFSLETQHTIGYGVRAITEECPEAIFILCLQSSFGVLLQAFMVGIVFAKITRSKNRSQTLLFSKHCCISQRNGELCLMFRIGDMRKSHIIGASVRAQVITKQTTSEGETMRQHQTELEVGMDGCGSNLFFIWPMIVVHKIDKQSPLYELSAFDITQSSFEVVVILEGTIESTGQTTQARSSYLNTEILWGHRFEPVVFYNTNLHGYEINYSRFDFTQFVETPTCSAKELSELFGIQKEVQENVDEKSDLYFNYSRYTLGEKYLPYEAEFQEKVLKNQALSLDEEDEFVMNSYAQSRYSLPYKSMRAPGRVNDYYAKDPDSESAQTHE